MRINNLVKLERWSDTGDCFIHPDTVDIIEDLPEVPANPILKTAFIRPRVKVTTRNGHIMLVEGTAATVKDKLKAANFVCIFSNMPIC